jgi:acetylornithine/LysW-gamma-L-lysine aminotransferase
VRFNNIAALSQAINGNTAAVILEVIQGEGGVYLADPAYLQAAWRLCDERGALLILDEVQTGFGRTGRFWACEHAGIIPDILCLAKGIAGGLPMGATCIGPRVPALPVSAHGSTFGGNPLACAAALATLDIIAEEGLVDRATAAGAYLRERLDRLANASPHIRAVRSLGLMLGIELRERVHPVLHQLTELGVLAMNAGPYVIRLLPPLVIEQTQLDIVADALEEVLS